MQIVKLTGIVGPGGKATRGQMIRVDEKEGMLLALSILNQIYVGGSNTERAEFLASDNEFSGRVTYFTVSVHPSSIEAAYKQRIQELESLLHDIMARTGAKRSNLVKLSSRKKK